MKDPFKNIDKKAIEAAYSIISSQLPKTPLTFSPQISKLVGHDIYFKWDNKQTTGSFKERGAVNFLTSLSPEERKSGVCGTSAGNHALAVSYHASRLGIPCTMFMPINAPLVKIESTIKNGAKVELKGNTFDEAYVLAQAHAKESGAIFIPPFDDPKIVCGQASAGLEVLEQLTNFDSAVIAVGGGGYISGISTAFKNSGKDIFVLGAQSKWSEDRRNSQEKFAPLSPGTIADGIAVKHMGGITLPIVEQNVDKLVCVTETEIEKAVISFLEIEHTVVEGAGAASLAALLQGSLPKSCKSTVVFVGGSNIDVNLLSRLIDRHQQRMTRLTRLAVSVPDRPGSLSLVTSNLSSSGANILETYHDRLNSEEPRNVDITFLLEVRNSEHIGKIIQNLESLGVRIH